MDDEDKRARGSWWTYWDKKLQKFNGPEVRGGVLAYSCWSPGARRQGGSWL